MNNKKRIKKLKKILKWNNQIIKNKEQKIHALILADNISSQVIRDLNAEIHAASKITAINNQALISCENANSEWKDKYKYATEFTQDILGL